MVAHDGAQRRSARSVHAQIKSEKVGKDAKRLHMLKKSLRKAQRDDTFFAGDNMQSSVAQAVAHSQVSDAEPASPARPPQDTAGPSSSARDGEARESDSSAPARKRKQVPPGQRVQMGALKGVRRKPKSQMERHREKGEAHRAEEDAEGRAKAEERRKHLKEMQQREAQRRKEKKLMFKRNKKGQPVMRHRVESILQGLGAA